MRNTHDVQDGDDADADTDDDAGPYEVIVVLAKTHIVRPMMTRFWFLQTAVHASSCSYGSLSPVQVRSIGFLQAVSAPRHLEF